jgi:hypothetical protein
MRTRWATAQAPGRQVGKAYLDLWVGEGGFDLPVELVRSLRLKSTVLMNPDTPFSRLALEEAKTAADAHLQLKVLEARTPDQVSDRFEDAEKAGAAGLLILEDPLIYSIRRKVADLAAQSRLPAMYVYRDSAEAGGLMSYGPDRREPQADAADDDTVREHVVIVIIPFAAWAAPRGAVEKRDGHGRGMASASGRGLFIIITEMGLSLSNRDWPLDR